MNKKIKIALTALAAFIIFGLILYKAGNVFIYKASSSRIKQELQKETEKSLFLAGSEYEKIGELVKARDVYRRIPEYYPNSKNISKAQDSLYKINIKILFSPVITSGDVVYKIQKGDKLVNIAKKYGVAVELISKANKIKDGKIKYGRSIKIPKSRFSIAVDKSQNILMLKADNEIIKTYRVSTGVNNSTPIGIFTIKNKIINPAWYTVGAVVPSGSPKNILGTRWMGLTKESYGIHGTTQPQSLGRSVTSGCVRMANADVEELYTIVPTGTEVEIVD